MGTEYCHEAPDGSRPPGRHIVQLRGVPFGKTLVCVEPPGVVQREPLSMDKSWRGSTESLGTSTVRGSQGLKS